MTALALWLGLSAERARKQKEAVDAVERAGGLVLYDWHGETRNWKAGGAIRFMPASVGPAVPQWLHGLLGEQLFQDVSTVIFRTAHARYVYRGTARIVEVGFSDEWLPARDEEIAALIPRLRDLRKLRTIYLEGDLPDYGTGRIGDSVEHALIAALPCCNVVRERMLTATNE